MARGCATRHAVAPRRGHVSRPPRRCTSARAGPWPSHADLDYGMYPSRCVSIGATVHAMPASLPHEGLIALFRNRPMLAPELLRDVLHVALPTYTDVRVESAELTSILPTEYRADLVVLLVEGKPVLGIIVEVQLREDPDKLVSWPAYIVNLFARIRCPVELLVVSPSASVAAWASRPIPIGASVIRPLVLGPSGVPVIRSVDEASLSPELAVLSAMAHGHDDVDTAVAIALAASTAAQKLGKDLWLLYFGLIRTGLGEAARKKFQMLPQGQQFFDESQQRSFERGALTGKAAGEASAILRVLGKRGLVISDAQREKILACIDIPTLESWLDKAVTAASTDELFV